MLSKHRDVLIVILFSMALLTSVSPIRQQLTPRALNLATSSGQEIPLNAATVTSGTAAASVSDRGPAGSASVVGRQDLPAFSMEAIARAVVSKSSLVIY